jgi:hypothetical protein
VTATDALDNTGARAYEGENAPAPVVTITISPASLAEMTAGTAVDQTITASGGTAPYTFAVTDGVPPDGLALSNSGALTGTPSAAGEYGFTVTATDALDNTGARAYEGEIEPAPEVTIIVSPASLDAMTAGTAVDQTIAASGGTAPYTFAVTDGALPDGLALSNAGALTGTPSAAGEYGFTVTATDALDNTGARAYDGIIGSALADLVITPASLGDMTVGVPFTVSMSAAGGTAPYTFAVTDGALPAGLTLDEDGNITGTPSASGAYDVTITVTDSGLSPAAASTASITYSGTVLAPVPIMPWPALVGLALLLLGVTAFGARNI